MDLSIVIPAYNEEKRIKKTLDIIIDYFENKKLDFEIFIVNDGSKDKTKEIIEEYSKKYKQVILLDNGKNRGKGYSVNHGVKKAQGQLILFSDADLSTPIEEYDKLRRYIDLGYDIIIGSRRIKGANIKIKQPLHRRILGKGFGFIVSLITIKGIKDTQCGFKLFKKDIAKETFNLQKISGFSFDVEILYIAKKKFRAKIKEVPITWIDSAKLSKVDTKKETFNMLKDLIKIRLIH